MKSKLFRILGVVTIVSMLAGMLAAPALADVSAVSVTFGTGGTDDVIAKANANYTVLFTPNKELHGYSSETFTLPAIGDAIRLTAVAATDTAKITLTSGSVAVVMSGAGTYTAGTGVITFSAIGETATITATVAGGGKWSRVTGLPTSAVFAGTATLGGAFVNTGDTITITFPTDTVIAGAATATIVASPGWAGSPLIWTNASVTNVTFSTVAGSRQIIAQLLGGATQDVIGSGSVVRINITVGITNPTTAGSFYLTVNTTQELNPVQSAPYTIINPVLVPMPGIVTGYNINSVVIAQGNSINTVANTTNVVKVTCTAGTYDEDVVLNNVLLTSISSTDGAATTFIKDSNADGAGGTVSIIACPALESVVFDGFTIYGRTGAAFSLNVAAGKYVKVQNCFIKCPGTAGIVTAGLSYPATTPVATFSVVNVDVTGTAVLGVSVTGSAPLFSGCIFNVDAGGTAVNVGVSTGTTFQACIFNGASGTGTGFASTAGVSVTTVDTCTFTGLAPALNIANAAVGMTFTVRASTFDTCGSVATSMPAIVVAGGTPFFDMFGCVVKNSPYYIGNVNTAGTVARFMFNDFSVDTNAKGFIQSPNTGTIYLAHNWWGFLYSGAAAPPIPPYYTTKVFNDTASISATTELILALGAAPTSAQLKSVTPPATTYTWTSTTTLPNAQTGYVAIPSILTGAVASTTVSRTGAASFSTCPLAKAPVSPMTVAKYFDVTIVDTTVTDTATIYFYNSGLTASARVFYYDGTLAQWDVCNTQSVNVASGYVMVTIATGCTPTLAALSASSVLTPIQYFAILDGYDTPGATDQNWTPKQGSQGASITPSFNWTGLVGAISYDFVIADDAVFSVPTAYSTPTNGFILPADAALNYGTQYWWRVRMVNAAGVRGAWTIGTFKTMAEPVTTTTTTAPPTTIVVTQPPQSPPVVTVLPQETSPVIPTYLIWIVIAVGAVLVIVVIVLIVRTRRIG